MDRVGIIWHACTISPFAVLVIIDALGGYSVLIVVVLGFYLIIIAMVLPQIVLWNHLLFTFVRLLWPTFLLLDAERGILRP